VEAINRLNALRQSETADPGIEARIASYELAFRMQSSAPELLDTRYAKEIWELYEAGELHPDIELTGEFHEDEQSADVDAVLTEISAAIEEEEARLERMKPDEL